MKFTYDGTEYKITFVYARERYAQRVVYCNLWDRTPAWEVVAKAYSQCHPDDQFCKETGRKVALRRALEGFDKPFRTAVWQAYHARGVGK